MGRRDLTKAATKLWRIVNKNVRKRLRILGMTPYAVSVIHSKRANWLGDSLRRNGQISLSTLADIAEAVGMSPAALCDPNARCDERVPDDWRGTDDRAR